MAPLAAYTLSEVSKHNSATSLWIVVDGSVYDVTPFADDHPGGADMLLDYAGQDASKIMRDELQHAHSESAFEMLAEYRIGFLGSKEQSDDVKNERLGDATSVADALAGGEAALEALATIPTDVDSDYASTKFLDLRQPLWSQMLYNNFSKEFYLKQVHIPRYLPQPCRVFENDWLEMLTRTHWAFIPVYWMPIICYYLAHALQLMSVEMVATLFVFGMALWTLAEYAIHRFLFHVDYLLPDSPFFLFLHFFLHGLHHYLPMDRLRLVMPPVLSTLIGLLRSVFGIPYFLGIGPGFAFAYIIYDLSHYYLHHQRPFFQHYREMKSYHLAHHYKNADLGFGITSRFWDRVFGTLLEV
ncbi:Inositolphosphorylceramide-B hydroxylase [Ramicandelaber brevisporus]|nr:Inositolphosphorylceramide-B hydroxylase [Ramicandelaber brevisporus]